MERSVDRSAGVTAQQIADKESGVNMIRAAFESQ
jgi:hypothetical protein